MAAAGFLSQLPIFSLLQFSMESEMFSHWKRRFRTWKQVFQGCMWNFGGYICVFPPIPGCLFFPKKRNTSMSFCCWKVLSFQNGKFYLGIFSGFWSSFCIPWWTKKSTKETSRSKLRLSTKTPYFGCSFPTDVLILPSKSIRILTEQQTYHLPCLVHPFLQGPWNLFDALRDLSKE